MAQHAPNADDPLPESNRATDGARLSPNAMSIADAARVLTRLGGQTVTEEMLRADIAAGAPVNSDGTVHLAHFAAWLVKEMSGGNRGDG